MTIRDMDEEFKKDKERMKTTLGEIIDLMNRTQFQEFKENLELPVPLVLKLLDSKN